MTAHDPQASSCATHRHYLLDCESFNALWERADGRCEICGTAPGESPHGVLHINHDGYLGDWAVRGLLCSRCNTSLPSSILGAERVAAYLADPWYRRRLAPYGVDIGGGPEPAMGTVVAGGRLKWRRTPRGWECITPTYRSHRNTRQPVTWERLDQRIGPHRVRVLAA